MEICVIDFTLARAELLASMALYPINEFAAKETCRGAEIESDAVVYRAIVDPEKEFDFVRNFVQSFKNVFSSFSPRVSFAALMMMGLAAQQKQICFLLPKHL